MSTPGADDTQIRTPTVPPEEKTSSIDNIPIIMTAAPATTSPFDDENFPPLPNTSNSIPLSPTYSMRTITLPETHIFTPEKGTSTISQSVDRELTTASFSELTTSQSVSSKGVIQIKEYHDIEYSLKLPSSESVPSSLVNGAAGLQAKKENFPIFGTSPTESTLKTDDDDFSEFQTAPPVAAPPVLKPKVNQLPLSPEHLLNNWGAKSSAVDDDEMLRIEAFARSKNPSNPVPEDDEWSDFVSSVPQKSTTTAAGDEDWSDFVFTTPASSQPIISGAKTSWNSPLPPTYTAGNYVPWSTGQSTTPAIAGSRVPELGFVAPKPVIKGQFMRKWLLRPSNSRQVSPDVIM